MLPSLLNVLLVATLAIVLIFAAIILIQLHVLGVPPLPSNRQIREAIMILLSDSRGGCRSQSPDIPSNSRDYSVGSRRPPRRIYELGSGWGDLSLRIAREHPDLPVDAVEQSLVPYLFARLMLALRRRSNLRFRLLDLEELSFEEPAVVITYLSSRHMKALSAKLPVGHDITLISAAFALPGRQPCRTIQVRDFYRTPVYRYEL